MKIYKILARVMLILGSALLLCACDKHIGASEKNITNAEFTYETINMTVNSSIDLSAINPLRISPKDIDEDDYTYTLVSNSDIIEIDGYEITAVDIGYASVTANILCNNVKYEATTSIVVTDSDTTMIAFSSDSLDLVLYSTDGSVSSTLDLEISGSNVSDALDDVVIEYLYNGNVTDRLDFVNYDIVSDNIVISNITEDKSFTIIAKYYTSVDHYIEDRCDVNVDYIKLCDNFDMSLDLDTIYIGEYATLTVTYGICDVRYDIDFGDTLQHELISSIGGVDKYKLYSIDPQRYNVSASIQVSKTEKETKQVNLDVIFPITFSEIEEIDSSSYVGHKYFRFTTSAKIDSSDVVITLKNITTNQEETIDGSFNDTLCTFTFDKYISESGSYLITVKYKHRVMDITKTYSLDLYDIVSDFDITYYDYEGEVIDSDDVWVLYQIDTNYKERAKEYGKHAYIEIVAKQKEGRYKTPITTKYDGSHLHVEYNNDKICLTVLSPGDDIIQIIQDDFVKTINFRIYDTNYVQCYAGSSAYTLTPKNNTASLNLKYYPEYAYNKDTTLTVEGDYITLDDGVVTFRNIGTSTIKFNDQVVCSVECTAPLDEFELDSYSAYVGVMGKFEFTLSSEGIPYRYDVNLLCEDSNLKNSISYSEVTKSYTVTFSSVVAGSYKLNVNIANIVTKVVDIVINPLIYDHIDVDFDESIVVEIGDGYMFTPAISCYNSIGEVDNSLVYLSCDSPYVEITGLSCKITYGGDYEIKILTLSDSSVVYTMNITVIDITGGKVVSSEDDLISTLNSGLDAYVDTELNLVGNLGTLNHKIIGIGDVTITIVEPLFDTISESAEFSNFKVKINDVVHSIGYITSTNNGKISDIEFINSNITVDGESSLVCNINNGEISHIVVGNMQVSDNGFSFYTIVKTNHGNIRNLDLNIHITVDCDKYEAVSNFIISGIGYNSTANEDLEIAYNTVNITFEGVSLSPKFRFYGLFQTITTPSEKSTNLTKNTVSLNMLGDIENYTTSICAFAKTLNLGVGSMTDNSLTITGDYVDLNIFANNQTFDDESNKLFK